MGCQADAVKAFHYYELAAHQGYAHAQCNLGVCYERGIGCQADPVKAFHYYELAAHQGDAQAQCNLGGCYEKR